MFTLAALFAAAAALLPSTLSPDAFGVVLLVSMAADGVAYLIVAATAKGGAL